VVKRLPALALALLLVGLLLTPVQTGRFVKSSVQSGWHAVSDAVSAMSSG
jgi:predicted small secreted protein